MKCIDAELISIFVALLGVIVALISASFALRAERKIRVLDFVSNQFNRKEVRKARKTLYRLSKNKNIEKLNLQKNYTSLFRRNLGLSQEL